MGTEAPDMLDDNEYPDIRTQAGTSASGLSDLLATENSTVGAFDGYAGEFEEWGYEFVRVVVRVKKSEAVKMKDCALIHMKW